MSTATPPADSRHRCNGHLQPVIASVEDASLVATEAEELALASAVIRDPDCLDSFPDFNPNEIRSEFAACLTATALRQHRDGKRPDIFTVINELNQGGVLQEKCGPDAVSRAVALASHPLTSDPVRIAREIHQRAKRRHLEAQAELLRAVASDPTASDERIMQMLADMSNRLQSQNHADRFKFMTMRELSEADLRIEFIIKGVLAAGLTGGVFGPSKGMKTSVMVAAAHSVSSATPFLGMFEVPRQRNVLLMSSESGLATIRSILTRISDWAHIDYRDLPITLCDNVPTLTSPEDVGEVERAIERTQSELVFLDPFYHMAGDTAADMANLSAMGRVLKEMPALGKRTGSTILYAHHLRKVVQIGEPSTLNDIQGSGHDAHVRQWWCLNRREEFDPNSGHAALWLNAGSSLGFSRLLAVDIDEGVMQDDGSGRYWSVTVNEPTAARRNATTERQQKQAAAKSEQTQATRRARTDKLLESLRLRPDGDTKNALKALAGMSGTVFDDIIADLLRCDAVIAETRQKHTRPETIFRLAEQWDMKVSHLPTYTLGGPNAAV